MSSRMTANTTAAWAIHFDFGTRLVEDSAAARASAEILCRPCFRGFERLFGYALTLTRPVPPDVESVVAYLSDPNFDAIYMDANQRSGRGALCELPNGVETWEKPAVPMQYTAAIAIPYVAREIDEVVRAACDLAACLRAVGGYIAIEPEFSWAWDVALGGFSPRDRAGLSRQRRFERDLRPRHQERIATELAVLEWGTFLGPGHLARIDLDVVRRSGAFAEVTQISSSLAYLQVTPNPTDDLTDSFEARRLDAREAVAPLLMTLPSRGRATRR